MPKVIFNMKKSRLALLFFLFLCFSCEDKGVIAPVIPPDNPFGDGNAYGTVSCDGTGVPGVVVSDGYAVCLTDARGNYSFSSTKRNGYLFISIPSGYECFQNGIQPQFFKYFSKPVKEAERLDFQLRKVNQSKYRVLFFGDMHLADRKLFGDIMQFRKFVEDVKSTLESEDVRTYAITLGDMSWDRFWSTNSYDLNSYLKEMNADFGDRLPVFHTMGNHDNDSSFSTDFLAAGAFHSILGPSYYSFNIGGIHYIVLDDIDYGSSSDGSYGREIVAEQALWMVEDLKHVDKSTPLIVTMHAPLYNKEGKTVLRNGYDGLIKYLKGYCSTFVTGHTHILYNVDRTDSPVSVYESNSGSVCGGWWVSGSNSGINLAGDGSPGGYRVMDVNGKTFSWRYKGTGFDKDVQFRSYDRNSICLSPEKWTPNASAYGKKAFLEAVGEYSEPSRSNEVLLNVWDWDSSWKIDVYEGGNKLKVSQLDDAKDPLYLICYEAYEYEHHYDDSVNYPAYTTNHIFKVKANDSDSTLDIRITDREGRVYRETMTRPKEFSIGMYTR